MFDIEYKGANAVTFTTKKSKVVVDPKLSEAGLKDVIVKDAVEITTEDRFGIDNPNRKVLFNGPGEYEVGDVSVKGVAAVRHIDDPSAGKQTTMYKFTLGDVRIALVGNIAPKLSEEQQEYLGIVDILILPVGGGGYTLDATSASAVVRQLEPKIVVPIHYADKAVKYEVPQDELETFVKELGAATEEPVNKLKIKSGSSIPEQLTIQPITRS